jgi:hypothetical protein
MQHLARIMQGNASLRPRSEDAPRIGRCRPHMDAHCSSAHAISEIETRTAVDKGTRVTPRRETTSRRVALRGEAQRRKAPNPQQGGRVTGAPAVPEEDNHISLHTMPPASCLAWPAKSRAHQSPRYRLSPSSVRAKHGSTAGARAAEQG